MLGEKLKEIRESQGVAQKEIASLLGVDSAYVSKMEKNGKPVNKQKIKLLAEFYNISESTLLPYWLAQKVLELVNHEKYAPDALKIALKEINK